MEDVTMDRPMQQDIVDHAMQAVNVPNITVPTGTTPITPSYHTSRHAFLDTILLSAVAQPGQGRTMYSPLPIVFHKGVLRAMPNGFARAQKFLEVLTDRRLPKGHSWWNGGAGRRFLWCCQGWETRLRWEEVTFQDGEVLVVVSF
jgi:hypothetical protein